MASERASAWRIADTAATAVIATAVLAWSVLYAFLGQLFLRPVSTCTAPGYRCTGAVDLGVSIGAWGPLVAAVLMLVAIAWSVLHRKATTPAAICGAAVVIGLGALGQVLVAHGVVTR